MKEKETKIKELELDVPKRRNEMKSLIKEYAGNLNNKTR